MQGPEYGPVQMRTVLGGFQLSEDEEKDDREG
jgi:hypothetical protein